jgi:hypothetical protein
MTIKSRLDRLEKQEQPKATRYKHFRPQTAAEIEAEKAESRALYSHLRAVVTSDDLPAILQDATNEMGSLLVRRFGSDDPATVRTDCIELLDYLEARL